METRQRSASRSSEGRIQRDAGRSSASTAAPSRSGDSRGGRTYDRNRSSVSRESARGLDRNREDATVQQRVDRSRGGSSSNGNRGSYDRDRSGSSDRNRGSYDRDRSGSSDRNRGSYDRNRGSNDRNRGTYNRGGSHDRNRGGSYDRNRGSYGSRRPYYHRGRVSRYEPWNGGYRVWVIGAPYPYFVPLSYWRIHPFRVGVEINIGGYYNPLGYYDYYDGPTVTEGALRGVVESVDFRRDTFVLRNEATGSFVTVRSRGGDRDLDRVRPGDYVEIEGDWSRGGVFEAYRLEFFDNDRY